MRLRRAGRVRQRRRAGAAQAQPLQHAGAGDPLIRGRTGPPRLPRAAVLLLAAAPLPIAPATPASAAPRAAAPTSPATAVAATAPSAPAPAGPLQPPVTPACVSSPFGPRHAVGPHAPAAFHNGIDLPAPAGALVRAAADGTVVAIRRQGLGGVTVHIAHPGGRTTLYAHLGNLVPAVAEGRRQLRAGDPIGHVARTGVTYGTHLFFAVLDNGSAVDPAPLLGVAPCR